MAARIEAVVGRYVHLEIDGVPHRVYYEEAGFGIPLLCLHTAGSDGRQYRGILNDSDVTKRFRVVVFDLPWHGKSSPPENFQNQQYRLTPQSYMAAILAMVEGLGLDRPVVMGCSIGARGVLYLLINHADKFRAGIALQASRSVGGALGKYQRELEYLARSDVNGGEAAAALVSGNMAPQSPSADKWETLWHYMQGGPGVLHGDGYFYRDFGNIAPADLARIDTDRTPLYVLNGEYDYSATPAHGEEVAKMVPGAKLQIMPDIGHFPPSENYSVLRRYLLPVLFEIK
jgi:pimeloyl-ACP methyl ester carboxylesterase